MAQIGLKGESRCADVQAHFTVHNGSTSAARTEPPASPDRPDPAQTSPDSIAWALASLQRFGRGGRAHVRAPAICRSRPLFATANDLWSEVWLARHHTLLVLVSHRYVEATPLPPPAQHGRSATGLIVQRQGTGRATIGSASEWWVQLETSTIAEPTSTCQMAAGPPRATTRSVNSPNNCSKSCSLVVTCQTSGQSAKRRRYERAATQHLICMSAFQHFHTLRQNGKPA